MVTIIMIAILVGIFVSLDVMGYNISQAANKEYHAKRWNESFWHAFYHFALLGIGIGFFTGVELGLLKLITYFQLDIYFPWAIDVPIRLIGVLAIGMFLICYYEKLFGGEDGDPIPNWMKFFTKGFARKHTDRLGVAVDMYYLTPLLKTILVGYSFEAQAGFMAIVFVAVLLCSLASIKYGRQLMSQRNVNTMAYVLTTLVLLEPMATGYFAVRLGFFTTTGAITNSVWFALTSVLLVLVAVCVYVKKETGERIRLIDRICDDKHDEAVEAVAT